MTTVKTGYLRDAERECEVVIFLDPENSDSFEIQRALYFDEQDTIRGWDTYCLVRGGGLTFYGGVKRLMKTEAWVEFELTDEAAQALGLPTIFGVTVDEVEYLAVAAHLLRMLESAG